MTSTVGLVIALAAAVLFGLAAVAQAHAVRRVDLTSGGLTRFVRQAARDPWTVAVVAAYLVGFLLHAVSIWLLPLYLAQATISLSLPVTALSSQFLRERLDLVDWAGIAGVTLGLVLVAYGAGTPGDVVTSTWFALALVLGAGALLLVVRHHAGLTGGMLGVLAGLGYAGSAIAVRGVEASWSPQVLVAAVCVPVFGLVAFWSYSLGMERAAVSTATAPMIVGQTLVPALVGVVFLGDAVRSGWWLGVLLGLGLALGGATVLSWELRKGGSAATPSSPDPAR